MKSAILSFGESVAEQVIILNSVTYLRGPRDQGVDQKLHGELKRRVLSLVHELLEAVSFACALNTVKFVSYAQSKVDRKAGWGRTGARL